MGDTSSNGCFSIVMLVFRGVCWQTLGNPFKKPSLGDSIQHESMNWWIDGNLNHCFRKIVLGNERCFKPPPPPPPPPPPAQSALSSSTIITNTQGYNMPWVVPVIRVASWEVTWHPLLAVRDALMTRQWHFQWAAKPLLLGFMVENPVWLFYIGDVKCILPIYMGSIIWVEIQK